jgi:hypothetical protein
MREGREKKRNIDKVDSRKMKNDEIDMVEIREKTR